MDTINTRQYIILVLFIQFSSKLVTMPTLVFSTAGKDAILSVALGCILELSLIFVVTSIIKRNPNTTLLQLLREKTGWIAYIIIGLLGIFLVARILYCLQELYSFFLENLYDELSLIMFIIPALLVLVYFSYKGLRTLCRALEILIWFIAAGMLIALLSNLEFVDWTKNLPLLQDVENIGKANIESAFLFATPCGLLFLVGKVDISPQILKKTLFTCSLGAVVIISACFIFYSVFGQSMQYVLFALSEYSQFDPYILELQRLIWLSAVVDITKLFLSAICLITLISSTQTKKVSFSIWVAGISIVILVLGLLTRFDTIIWFDITKSALSYFSLGIIVIVNLLFILSLRRKNE